MTLTYEVPHRHYRPIALYTATEVVVLINSSLAWLLEWKQRCALLYTSSPEMYVTSHPSQLSLLLSAGWKTSTGYCAVMLYG